MQETQVLTDGASRFINNQNDVISILSIVAAVLFLSLAWLAREYVNLNKKLDKVVESIIVFTEVIRNAKKEK